MNLALFQKPVACYGTGVGVVPLACMKAGLRVGFVSDTDSDCRRMAGLRFSRAVCAEMAATAPAGTGLVILNLFSHEQNSPEATEAALGSTGAFQSARSGGGLLIAFLDLGFLQGECRFRGFLGRLSGHGAVDIGWRVLDSSRFGAPVSIRAVVVVASFGSHDTAAILGLDKREAWGPQERVGESAGGAPGDLVFVRSTKNGNEVVPVSEVGGVRTHPLDYELRLGVPTGEPDTYQLRTLSPVEWERVIGLPDRWTLIPLESPSAESAGLNSAEALHLADGFRLSFGRKPGAGELLRLPPNSLRLKWLSSAVPAAFVRHCITGALRA